ncbi:MAG: hypothetical protein Kow00107_02390 [Planctomycetota bacterium]
MKACRSGFTLVELMVALGLAVVIIVAMAQVFGISTKVVSSALLQAEFYSRLGTAHAFLADEFANHDHKEISDVVGTYSTKWTITEPGESGASMIVLAGSGPGEGILFQPVQSFPGFSAADLPTSGTPSSSSHRLLTASFEAFYCDNVNSVILDGPEETPTYPFVFYFASNEHD